MSNNLFAIKYSTFTFVVPSTRQKVKFRTYNTKEFELILKARAFQDIDSEYNAISDVLNACSAGILDISSLQSTDIEYLYLMLRSKSQTNALDLAYRCYGTLADGSICNNRIPVTVDLNNVEVIKSPQLEEYSVIYFDDENSQGIKLKEPNYLVKRLIKTQEESLEDNIELFGVSKEYLFACVEYIFDGDNMLMPVKDFNIEDFSEWCGSIPKSNLKDFQLFFMNLSRVGLKEPIHIKCAKCGNEDAIILNDFDAFLD